MDNQLLQPLTGSLFPLDLVMYSHTSLPKLVDRKQKRLLIEYDKAGYILLFTENKTRRLLFSNDLKYPTYDVISKEAFFNKINKAMRFDPLLSELITNGIPIKSQVFFPRHESSLSEAEVLKIVDYYDDCDSPEKMNLKQILASNGVFALPRLQHFSEIYSTTINGLPPGPNSSVISEGWYFHNKVLRKQILTS